MDYLKRLERLMTRLRSKSGCPWDKRQTHKSLKPYLLEEAHEVLEAIDQGDKGHLREELGDLLLQVVFHSQLAKEKGKFTLQDVAKGIGDKLVRRHPHVFGKSSRRISDINRKWEELKRQEKPERKSALDGLPKSLPSLLRSQRMFEKISKQSAQELPPIAGINKAYQRFKKSLKGGKASKERAAGELLLSFTRLSQSEGLHAEMALRKASSHFEKSFRRQETRQKRRERGKN
ncbi:MAG TPA: nucleoside triphosphate pyrophosphohydrolase [bacterium]|nr:nucleoside triphosphate pyrophosphohydrolase [bacterium]